MSWMLFVHRYGDLWTDVTVASFSVRIIIIIIFISPHLPRYITIRSSVRRSSGRPSCGSRS